MTSRWALFGTLIFACTAGHAQSMEPRAYSNGPVGMNFLIVGVTATRGGLSFDTLPLTNARLRASSAVLAYARTLDLAGMSGKFDVILPYSDLAGSANYAGQPVNRSIHGFSDAAFRLSVNFLGAPALAIKDFASYRQDLIMGASLQVTAPSSQYDPSRLINIGTNRWSFKPELGISKALGRWTVEGQAGATLFTENRNFYSGNTRSQAPLYSVQGHLIYNFRSGMWASLDATWFTGGRSTLNGILQNDFQQNWRAGGTLAFPIDRRSSIKFYASSGLSARTGNNYDLLGVAWQYRWQEGF